jgi:ABC transporter substrate binding protein (PQQ-dependent alcohol dehydrogenase system)
MALLAGRAWAGQTIAINYVSLITTQPPPSAMMDKPPTDTGLRGAELAIADTNTTGRFTGQTYTLHVLADRDPAVLRRGFAQALAAGARFFVTDLPAALLVELADTPAAKDAILLDATTADDRLRGADCRANTLHILPSRAMLADALMQYLVSKSWTRIMLLTGRDPQDALYAEAIRHAAEPIPAIIR